VEKNSAIDLHAQHNTTSIYTPLHNFLMLPEKLSTGLTSLNPDVDRIAMVVEITVNNDGAIQAYNLYRGMLLVCYIWMLILFAACVHNKAKLVYNRVATWLEGAAPVPDFVTAIPGLWDNIRLHVCIIHSLSEHH
jgi:exoribonuclease-2